MLYFFEQYIKFGFFVGGAGIEQKDTESGKKDLAELNLAKQGKCSVE